jgi:hypothetical protein
MEQLVKNILERDLLDNDYQDLTNNGFFDLLKTNEAKLVLLDILAEEFIKNQNLENKINK